MESRELQLLQDCFLDVGDSVKEIYCYEHENNFYVCIDTGILPISFKNDHSKSLIKSEFVKNISKFLKRKAPKGGRSDFVEVVNENIINRDHFIKWVEKLTNLTYKNMKVKFSPFSVNLELRFR